MGKTIEEILQYRLDHFEYGHVISIDIEHVEKAISEIKELRALLKKMEIQVEEARRESGEREGSSNKILRSGI